jgi:2-oxoglutarate ferredoxin oxidoreductase subunit alpha
MNGSMTIIVAGAAGQGMQTIGFLLAKALIRSGLNVFAVQDNESRIRGGHNFFSVRVSADQVVAMTKSFDMLVALDQSALSVHEHELIENTVVIYDQGQTASRPTKGRACTVPLKNIALAAGGNEIYSNAVALGAILGIVRCDIAVLEPVLKGYFSGRPEVAAANYAAARAGYEYVHTNHGISMPLPFSAVSQRKMFVNGNEAIALGALAAGCQFYAAYPMSPATSILTYLAGKADTFHMVVEQPEDEIAAINMAIGASCVGVRAMTATSGGGFSLMVESLGLAGIAEVPLVVIDAQRPGPATGLATRTEQADLRFVIHAAQGEFPRVVLAPGTAREAFELTRRAFAIADQYHIPVIILTDQYLADSYFTEERFTCDGMADERFFSSPPAPDGPEPFLRYQFTESGVSQRYPISGTGKELLYDSHEHSERGHITEDARIRTGMMQKRFRKQDGIVSLLSPPVVEGAQDADLLVVGWGSTYGVLHEVTAALNRESIPVRCMHVHDLWPFPEKAVSDEIAKAKKWVVLENNYTSQLSGIIMEKTRTQPSARILKYDGRPFYYDELLNQVRKEIRS